MRNPKCFKSIPENQMLSLGMTYWLTRATYRATGVKIFCAFAQKHQESDASLEECFCKNHGITIQNLLFLGILLILLYSSILPWHVPVGLYSQPQLWPHAWRTSWAPGGGEWGWWALPLPGTSQSWPVISPSSVTLTPLRKGKRSQKWGKTGRFKTRHKWRPEAFHPSSELAFQKQVVSVFLKKIGQVIFF